MPTPSLSGQFLYRSFRNGPIDVVGGDVVGSSVLAEPWTPEGTLDVKTDTVMGDIVGTLTFPPGATLNVTGRIVSATAKVPASVELRGEGLGAVYQIRGWFVPDANHLVGSVLCVKNDIAKQPNGTVGAFILYSNKQP